MILLYFRFSQVVLRRNRGFQGLFHFRSSEKCTVSKRLSFGVKIIEESDRRGVEGVSKHLCFTKEQCAILSSVASSFSGCGLLQYCIFFIRLCVLRRCCKGRHPSSVYKVSREVCDLALTITLACVDPRPGFVTAVGLLGMIIFFVISFSKTTKTNNNNY